jgi:probable HAF family extracellular repeat protein
MKSRFLMCFTAITFFAVPAMPVRVAAQDNQGHHDKHVRYKLTLLETLPGGTQNGAQAINNKGQVTGFGWLPGNTEAHAVLWNKGVITDLGTLQGGPFSGTFAYPNQKGEISGESNTTIPDPNGVDFCFFSTNLQCLGFLWRDGVLTALPTLGGNNSYAYQLNNREQVVGLAENTTQDPTCTAYNLEAKPVIWQKGKVQELPTIPGDPDGFGYWINDRGQIVVLQVSATRINRYRAFTLCSGRMGPTVE